MKKTVLFFIWIVSFLLSSCGSIGGTPQVEAPNVETIVAATYAAISAETARAQALITPTATDTATPTKTSTPTSTATYTPTYIIPSMTPSATITQTPTNTPGIFDCAFVSQSPKNGTVFSPREEVKLSWVVKNIGAKEWIQSDVKYFFLRGDKFYKREIYGLPYNTATGQEVELRIDLVAPKEPGSYEMIWAMKRGQNHVFCETTFKFTVE